MKRFSFLFTCVVLISGLYAQNPTGKVNTKYLRPSITMLFSQPKDADEEVVISKFRNLEVNSKFDNHRIDFPDMKPIEPLNLQKNALIEKYVRTASNPVIAKWWGRDANGNFNYSLVAERGSYTATDADAIISRGSNTSRIEMIGEQLIDKSYILLYEITDLYSMEEYYDRQDALNRKLKNYTPVKRTDEGYNCNYKVYAYKINFNDSVASEFYSRYWVDSKNPDKQKVAAWADATFPVKLIASTGGSVRSAQSKEKSLNTKKKTMRELLEDIPANIQNNAVFELGRKIEDFKLKVTVFKAYPVSAKLGTKEDLYIDQRFYVYEIEQDRNGNQMTNRKGVVRVKTINENKQVATGSSLPSVFQQVDGGRIYPGMFMESKDDYGLILNIGKNGSSNNAMEGFNIGADFRISRFLKKPGWHLGIDASLRSMKDVYAGDISTSTRYLINSNELCSGSTYAVAVNLSKESYFTRKGNVYLRPQFGVGLQSYSFKEVGGYEIASDNKDYSWSSLYVPLGIGVGWNITPMFSLEMKPGVFARFAASTDNKEKLIQSAALVIDNWGFGNIGKMNVGTTNTICLRIRF
ncbi:MAG TPA: autotransporter outer membrane beta-barrel domain-containing protein [Paludibacteraceae bacterium]|nr:autotransporter outer membrane beta-barrel domain-containing protein [Paludibacteraceae bacterium]